MSVVNIGDFEPAVRTMGPGLRACIWTKGCAINCAGCATPQFIPQGPAHLVDVAHVCRDIESAKAQHGIIGISFSGGEPFDQAEPLADIAQHARAIGLSTLSWSGYTKAFLESRRAPRGAARFIATLDVLIDGPFLKHKTSGAQPLCGSTNQTIHFLTDRHTPAECRERIVSAHTKDGRLVITGVHQFAATRAMLKLLGIA